MFGIFNKKKKIEGLMKDGMSRSQKRARVQTYKSYYEGKIKTLEEKKALAATADPGLQGRPLNQASSTPRANAMPTSENVSNITGNSWPLSKKRPSSLRSTESRANGPQLPPLPGQPSPRYTSP